MRSAWLFRSVSYDRRTSLCSVFFPMVAAVLLLVFTLSLSLPLIGVMLSLPGMCRSHAMDTVPTLTDSNESEKASVE